MVRKAKPDTKSRRLQTGGKAREMPVDTNYTIEVSGCDPDTKTETVELYFDNERRSRGGGVTECRQKGYKFFVTFENQDVMVRVLENPKHVINSKRVQVRKAKMKDIDSFQDVSSDEDLFEDCRLEVTGFKSDTSIELLELYFESKRRSGGGSLISIDKDNPEKMTLTFESYEAKMEVLQRQHTLDNITLTVKDLKKE
ncbi:uncharacterized protein LOC144350806 [Saccoglossus kowalevskii]